MKGLLKKLFARDTESSYVDASRRRFLKGAAGVAAVMVVAGPGGFVMPQESDLERLRRMIADGRVEGQAFLLDRTAVLEGLNNVTFYGCTFIATADFEGDSLLHFENTKGLRVENCNLDVTRSRRLSGVLTADA